MAAATGIEPVTLPFEAWLSGQNAQLGCQTCALVERLSHSRKRDPGNSFASSLQERAVQPPPTRHGRAVVPAIHEHRFKKRA